MIEYATFRRAVAPEWLESSLSRVHPKIVRAVNAARRKRGLPLAQTAGDPAATLVRHGNGYRSVPASQTSSTTRASRPCSTSKAARWAELKAKADRLIPRLRRRLRQAGRRVL